MKKRTCRHCRLEFQRWCKSVGSEFATVRMRYSTPGICTICHKKIIRVVRGTDLWWPTQT